MSNVSRRALIGGAVSSAALGTFATGTGAAHAAARPADGYRRGRPRGAGWIEVLSADDPGFAVPPNFYGWHRQGNLPAAPYPYTLTRSHDWTFDEENPATFWYYIQRGGPGTFDWSGVDQWIDIHRRENPDRKLCYTLFWTPKWASSMPPGTVWTDKYPGWLGGAWPPADMSDLRKFVTAFKDRYPADVIDYFEVWNEPDTYNHTDPTARNQDPGAHFYRGSMIELVQMHQVCKEVLDDRPVLSGGWNSKMNLGLFCRTQVDGKYGLDYCDWLAYHPYMYNYNPQIAWTDAGEYRKVLTDAADALNRPAWRRIPMLNTEMGHAYRDGNAPGIGVDIMVRNMKQAVGFSVAAAIAYDTRGVILYADHKSPRTFQGPIHASPELTAAATYCNRVEGKTVRQAMIRLAPGEPHKVPGRDYTVWLRFSDNTQYEA